MRRPACPERFVTHWIGRAQADVTETGNAGIAGAADGRAPGKFDLVAGRIAKPDEVANHASIDFFACAHVDSLSECPELGGSAVEVNLLRHLETRNLNSGIAFEITECVLAGVRLEVACARGPLA